MISFASASPLAGGAEVRHLKAADMTDDGSEEVIFSTASQVYYIQYTGPSSINLQAIYTSSILHYIDALEVGDFNNDDHYGFAVTAYRASTFHVEVDVVLNTNLTLSTATILQGTFGPIPDIAVGDINNDGRDDIATNGNNNFWFRSFPNGSFTSEKTISTASSEYGKIAIMDYDDDGDKELLTLTSDGVFQSYDIDINEIWLYSPETILTNVPYSDIWKYDNIDGDDVLITGSQTDIVILRNTGSSFAREDICSNINGLKDVTSLTTQDGTSDLLFTNETQASIRRIEVQTASIDEMDSEQTLNIYPNPANQQFRIDHPANDLTSVQVFNVLGDQVAIFTTPEVFYNIEHLPSGVYVVVAIDQAGNQIKQKLVKE